MFASFWISKKTAMHRSREHGVVLLRDFICCSETPPLWRQQQVGVGLFLLKEKLASWPSLRVARKGGFVLYNLLKKPLAFYVYLRVILSKKYGIECSSLTAVVISKNSSTTDRRQRKTYLLKRFFICTRIWNGYFCMLAYWHWLLMLLLFVLIILCVGWLIVCN